MYCHYHESSEAVKSCARCSKQLCGECYHTEFPDYCWSCGLDHSNALVEREKEFQVPAQLTSTKGVYIVRKLASAGGTYFAIALIPAGLFAFWSVEAAFWVAVIAGAAASSVTYTYGIAYSMLVDWIMKVIRMNQWYLELILYAVGGAIYSILIHFDVWSLRSNAGYFVNIICSLIFYGMNRLFMPQRRRQAALVVAVIAIIPVGFIWVQYGLQAIAD
jgi:hypothetical protein